VMYILTEGEVHAIVRKPNSMSKARGKRSGLTVATFTPVRYFGEYGVFAEEPRSATLYCAQRTVAWACSQECLVRYLMQLPIPVRRGIDAAFEANMAWIYPVRAPQLAALLPFRGAPFDALTDLVTHLEPVCVSSGTVILEAGGPGTCLYFIAKGRCMATDPASGREEAFGAGEAIGVRACIFLEPHIYTVRTLNTVQAWCLNKSILQDFMLSRPHHFLEIKQRLNAAFALTLDRPTLNMLEGSSLGNHLSAMELGIIWTHHLRPFVVEAGAPLVSAREAVDAVLYIARGSATDGSTVVGPGDCLGLLNVMNDEPLWGHTVVARDRVEGWRLSLGALASIPVAASPAAPRSRRALLRRLHTLQWIPKGGLSGDGSSPDDLVRPSSSPSRRA